MRAVGGAGSILPAEADRGLCPPCPPGTASGTAVPGCLVCGGLGRRPPRPLRVRAGQAAC